MKKKIAKSIILVIFIAITVCAIVSTYNWIVSGEQQIKISTSSKVYTDSDLFLSIIAQKNGEDLDTKSKIKLLNADGKKVKNVEIIYGKNNAKLRIPNIEPGNYKIKAKVSSKAGKDTVEKDIYISNGHSQNTTITFDKGIYKPGDTVNFRALLTSKDNDMPINKDTNISIYDGNDNKVYNENVKTSDYGIVSGSFTLANEVNSGIYKLKVKTDDNETIKQFKVNPYITPKYEVKINYDKQNYLVGDTANISINAKYFFGQPVSGAKYSITINNEKKQEIVADNEGNANIKYEIKTAKTNTIKVEAVDSSNYFIEETSSFIASTDKFEIEFLPEYGRLIEGKKNDVYVFTKTADGKPLKTYVSVSAYNFTKQIATDENGIGKFQIDIEKYNNSNNSQKRTNNNYDDANELFNDIQYSDGNSKTFSVIATNMEGEKVRKNIKLNIVDKKILIKTDKVKYNQGDEIKLNIESSLENTKNIYFFKNDKLVKLLNTDSSDTSINLDDVYGLIDIYVTEKTNNNYVSSSYINGNLKNDIIGNRFISDNLCKKTIFIKPSKELNINVKTDKDEYKPGDKINISFETTDENKNNIDAALLVSMLDNSILNLADNDLSIDNIKLALQDIEFTDDIDAGTLYSSIIDDASEQTIMTLLLKQKDRDIKVSENIIQNYDSEENYTIASIVSITLFVIIAISILAFKFEKVRNILKHALNFLIYLIMMLFILAFIEDLVGWNYYNDSILAPIIVMAIITLATYIAWISKLYDKIYKTSIYILISTIVLSIFISILMILDDISLTIVIIIAAFIILIMAIISKLKDMKIIKDNSKINTVICKFKHIMKFALIIVGSSLIGIIVGTIIKKIIYVVLSSDIEEINLIVPFSLICIYLFNYLFRNIGQNTYYRNENKKIDSNKIIETIIIILAVIGVIAIIGLGLVIYNQSAETVGNVGMTESERNVGATKSEKNETNSSRFNPSSIIADAQNEDATISSKSNGISSMFDEVLDTFDSSSSKEKNMKNQVNENTDTQIKEETVQDDNIRNVFLESMCFIPELVTSNGRAELDFKLSDNITTWTIQTVGNTKDGKIGYGLLDNVKVFKEFFVDFELPKNLVETDKVNIPVTVYNYTEGTINTTLKINKEDWFELNGDNNINVNIDAKSSKMTYVPLTILKHGNYKLRIEVNSESLTDIVEKELTISPKGYKVEKVISTGNLDEDISEDILFLEDFVENTPSAKVKIYANTMSQTVEGMENIFRMPTGCFEQISSSLYPNILALKYMEENGIVNEELRQKALNYISSGYQKILTYEVKGEKGGYSLYGHSPAETVLTAYGLMEISDLKGVYSVDDNVIENMKNYLYSKQNYDGSFTITGNHLGGANSRDKLALNAYITWALSECDKDNSKLSKSIDYLKNKTDKINDNYTIALIANALANVNDKDADKLAKRLINNVKTDGDNAYISSNIVDYYGSRGNAQTIQTVALTSMVLSKTSHNVDVNKKLINYLISKKDYYGTWYSTQATILSLKALNEYNVNNKIDNQTITVKVNSEEKKIDIKDNSLDLYEVEFNNLNKENKINIDIQKGGAYYEIIEEYYIPYEKVNTKEDNIEVSVEANTELSVNEIIDAKIKLINKGKEGIYNGMVTINIPQGFATIEDSLMLLQTKGIIEKYETNYSTVNIYLRNFEVSQIINLDVKFRALYPVDITGLAVKGYDYYNPETEGKSLPVHIVVK